MGILIITVLLFIIVIFSVFFGDIYKEYKREKVRLRPFPENWRAILNRNVRFYPRLTKELRDKLEKDIAIFVEEKHFDGCGGLKITEEIKVTIAAQAMMLSLNRKARYYPKLVSIVVYPSAYIVRGVRYGDGLVREDVRSGESYSGGVVVLSWEDVLKGASGITNGENVAIHEFTHQLDQEKGRADGVPLLGNLDSYREWAAVFQSEYNLLSHDLKARMEGVMTNYGLTNPAEFFAVATELFFEKPNEFREKHSSLYAELSKYYNTDPAQWQQEEEEI